MPGRCDFLDRSPDGSPRHTMGDLRAGRGVHRRATHRSVALTKTSTRASAEVGGVRRARLCAAMAGSMRPSVSVNGETPAASAI